MAPNRNEAQRVATIIPALNEERALGKVLDEIPKGLVDDVIVVDNGSSDRTAEVARRSGAKVISEPRKGYGHACLAGIDYVSTLCYNDDDIIVFLDGDHSDYPEDMAALVGPIREEGYDMVIGSRISGRIEEDAMEEHAKLANIVICRMLSLVLRRKVTDMGPFRALRFDALRSIGMSEKDFGWTTEMLVKASHKGLSIKEVPVRYRKRIGRSKISGSAASSIKAMARIMHSILKYSLQKGRYAEM